MTIGRSGNARQTSIASCNWVWKHQRWSVGTVHCMALDEDGRLDAVAGIDVGDEVIEQIAASGRIPEMVVGINDRTIRLDDGFDMLRQPIRPDRNLRGGGGYVRNGHDFSQ